MGETCRAGNVGGQLEKVCPVHKLISRPGHDTRLYSTALGGVSPEQPRLDCAEGDIKF